MKNNNVPLHVVKDMNLILKLILVLNVESKIVNLVLMDNVLPVKKDSKFILKQAVIVLLLMPIQMMDLVILVLILPLCNVDVNKVLLYIKEFVLTMLLMVCILIMIPEP